MRWLHTYTSMIALILVLFFSITGITLNHPEWSFGAPDSNKKVEGELNMTWLRSDQVDWLAIAETLRQRHGLKGIVSDKQADENQGSITFKGPGYNADCFFDRKTGSYSLDIEQQGWLNVMNDLHRGRDAGKNWALFIDVSGIILTLISITGLAMIFFLKKVRWSGLAWMVAGGIITYYLAIFATK